MDSNAMEASSNSWRHYCDYCEEAGIEPTLDGFEQEKLKRSLDARQREKSAGHFDATLRAARRGEENEYTLADGARVNGDVQKIGEALAALPSKTPESVLAAARSKRSPLHGEFEWDDSEAAQRYRLEQASYLLRVIKVNVVVQDREPVKVRAFVQLKQRQEYRPVIEVLSEAESRAQLLDLALRELRSFRQKYAALSELSRVHAVIDSLLD